LKSTPWPDKRHTYSIRLDWTGNQDTGTSAYRAYSRAHEISAQSKTALAGSSDPVFPGDATLWNPAELLIAALSACHQLWYLHLCADTRYRGRSVRRRRLRRGV
jgi:organic hydroperoxide reductase OsmC/OhrA